MSAELIKLNLLSKQKLTEKHPFGEETEEEESHITKRDKYFRSN